MKKIFLFAAICGLFASSCTIDRQYLNGPDASGFPSSQDEIESGLFAAYKALTSIDASSTPFPGIQDNCADIGAPRVASGNYNGQQISAFKTSNGWTEKMYSQIYKINGRISLVYDNIDKLADQISEQDMKMYKAELLCLRAYIYDMGCQFFGDVPYIDHTLALGETYDRTPRAEVIDKILNECLVDEYIEALPARHKKSDFGNVRIGRATAYGIKARICLNWGKYADAAKYADLALTAAAEGGYSLTNYDTAFCGEDHTKGEPSCANIFGINQLETTDEMMWVLEYNTAIDGNQHNAMYYAAPRTCSGCAYWGPSQHWVDAVQCIDGKSIVESSLYDPSNPWKNRDPRLELFTVRPGSRVLGFQFETAPSIKKIMNYNTGKEITNSSATGTKSEYGTNGKKGPGGYLWRKYLDIIELQNNNYSFGTSAICVLSYPLMRLSELYLIRAEANIENNTNLALAKSDIEAVRAKAGMPALADASQAALRSAVRYERMVELANEGFRWFDIRRWGIANKVMNGPMYAPAYDGTLSNAKPIIDANWCVTYDPTAATWDGNAFNLRTFCEKKYDPVKDLLWPIPDAERNALPHIAQNPGY